MKITFFYTPKPRQFKYSPRFYDPEQEKFEELKAKYKLNHKYDSIADEGDNSELAYFRSRVKSFDRKKNNSDFTLASIFKKKEMGAPISFFDSITCLRRYPRHRRCHRSGGSYRGSCLRPLPHHSRPSSPRRSAHPSALRPRDT